METSQIQSGTKVDSGIQMFNTVQSRLEKLNIYEILSSILLTDNIEEISEEQLEVLGGISYLVGLDFHSLDAWNDNVMTNVLSRLLINKVDNSMFNKFVNVMQLFKDNDKMSLISDARVALMSKVKSEILFESVEIQNELMDKIRSVINLALIPVEITQDLWNRFFEKDSVIYHDVLVFNSFAYNESIFNGDASQAFIDLSNDPVYVDALRDASNYFELQKFGLFYEESILNFFNKNIYNENDMFSLEFFNIFLTEENIAEYNETKEFGKLEPLVKEFYEINIHPQLTESAPEPVKLKLSTEDEVLPGVETKPLTHSVETLNESIENPLENPTEVIKHILYDFNKIRTENDLGIFDFKNKPTALIELVESMLEVEDIVGSFYMFLSKYNEFKATEGVEVSKIDTTQIFNYSIEELQSAFNAHIAELQTKYKDIIGDYIKELSETETVKLNNLVNDILRKLYIGNVEDKGFIFSQLNENTIFTNKHLHQIIVIIENQYILGSDVKDFVDFKTTFETDYSDIVTLFEESQQLESFELRIKLLYTFISAFN